MAGQSYYEILCVSRMASPREIRRAYRALARKYHPDFNPGDDAAAQKFREIQQAYDVLSDAQKRKAYDYYGPEFGARVPSATSIDYTKPRAPRTPAREYRRAAASSNPVIQPDFNRWPTLFLGKIRYRLGILAFASVFVLGGLIYLLLPNPGVKEFKRAQQALRHVQSWKTEMHIVGTNSTTGDYLQEISCPASEHFVQHIRGLVSGNYAEMTINEITVGNDHYLYNEHTNSWSRQFAGMSSPASACVRLAAGEDVGLLPPIGEWLKGMYNIEKGSLRKTTDGKCREWKITGLGTVSPQVAFVCLGVQDHLPKFEGQPGNLGEIRFYDWNVPIDIRPPVLSDHNP